MTSATDDVVTLTVKCDLDSDEIFGCQKIVTSTNNSLHWLVEEFCQLKNVKRIYTFALRKHNVIEFDLNSTVKQCHLVDGDAVYIYNTNPSTVTEQEGRGSHPSNWWLLTFSAFIIGVCGLAAVICVRQLSNSTSNLYGVVVDAGSSSSKIYNYRWTFPLFSGNGIVSEVSHYKTDTSLDKPGGVVQIYNALILSGKTDIPFNKLSNTEIFLGATAGMRILHDQNANKSNEIFQDVREKLSGSGFLFNEPSKQARIISGTEEGLNGWITINYLLELLKRGSATYGSLDLGGASTQIAFSVSPKEASFAPSGFVSNLTLYHENYQVYSQSFLCYGKNDAQIRLMALLAKNVHFNSSVENPCAPSGSIVRKTVGDIFRVPCTRGSLARSSYGFDVDIPSSIKDDFAITFHGKSQPILCQKIVRDMFNTSVCDQSSCSFNNVYQPSPKGKFLAFSGFFYTMQFFNLTREQRGGQQASLNVTRHTVSHFCELAWDQVKDVPVSSKNFLLTYCFDGNFILQLLNLYGFKDEMQWSTLDFVESVKNSTVGWSLGYMIAATGHIHGNPSFINISLTSFILLVVLFTLFIILAGIFLYLGVRRRRQRNYISALGRDRLSYGTV